MDAFNQYCSRYAFSHTSDIDGYLISRKCDQLLHHLGYSKKHAEMRVKVFDKISASMARTFQALSGNADITKILIGSKREGITLLRESDTDLMFIFKNIVCLEKNPIDLNNYSGKSVFFLDKKDSPCGYTYLRPADLKEQEEFVKDSFVSKAGVTYLSSTKFLEQNGEKLRINTGWIKSKRVVKERRGPSLPETLRESDFYDKLLEWVFGADTFSCAKDCVPALPVNECCLLSEWEARERRFDWPNESTINHILNLPIFLVPVGEKGSKNEDLQWRISFTFAEIHLVQQFTDRQIQILVILRWISQIYLKPIYREMTSYTMKNVVFWLFENIRVEEKSLQDCIDTSLCWLLSCVKDGFLPCYMLPERNLLVNLDDETRSLLIWRLRPILKDNVIAACTHFLLAREIEPVYMECLSNNDVSHYMEMTVSELSTTAIECMTCSSVVTAHFYLLKAYAKSYMQNNTWSFIIRNARKLICLAEPTGEMTNQAKVIRQDRGPQDEAVVFSTWKRIK